MPTCAVYTSFSAVYSYGAALFLLAGAVFTHPIHTYRVDGGKCPHARAQSYNKARGSQFRGVEGARARGGAHAKRVFVRQAGGRGGVQ